MSAWDGLQPDVLWGQDCGTSCDCVLLAAALVPGHPGTGTGGNSVHHHHLHPEVIGADDQSGACCFSVFIAYICGTHFMLMNVWIGICSGSVLVGGWLWRGLHCSVVMGAQQVSRNGLFTQSRSKAGSILQDYLVRSFSSLSNRRGVVLLPLLLL